jgi:hypothetical protein
MPALGSHLNVWNTCLIILRERGWKLGLEGDEEADLTKICMWSAEKNGYDLWADNPIELLGLAAVYDQQAPTGEPEPYWWRVEGDDIYDELLEAKWPDDD